MNKREMDGWMPDDGEHPVADVDLEMPALMAIILVIFLGLALVTFGAAIGYSTDCATLSGHLVGKN